MATDFKLQDPGEGIHEAEIQDVKVEPGQEVSEEDPLFTVETDKAAVDIPSTFDGTIAEVKVEAGQRVEVGATLLTYEPAGQATDEDTAKKEDTAEKEDTEKEEDAGEEEAEAEAEATEKSSAADQEAAADQAESRREAEAPRPRKKKAPPPDAGGEEQPREKTARGADEGPVPASPSTRRLARELGVDLGAVEGSGPEGRVTADDVRAAGGKEAAGEESRADMPREGAAGAEAAGEEADGGRSPVQLPRVKAPRLPDFAEWGEIERVPLRSVRRATAERMALSWSQVAHVTHQDVADITELERFRRDHQQEVADAGGKLTLTVLVMKAVIGALREHPRFNASIDVDREEIILKKFFHLGVAVETPRGLVVPVIREADRKSITDLAVELTGVAERAREGDLSPREMTGGTFTITNPGPIGGTGFTPIINWPQVAILGVARAALQPVVVGDLEAWEVDARLRLPLALAFDHRVVDGADAAHFCARMVELLADPESLMLVT